GAVVRQQRLVGGHDVLAGGERAQDERTRWLETADQFDDDLHPRIAEDLRGVAGHRQRGQVKALARTDEVGVGDRGEREPAAGALLETLPLRGENFHAAGADGAKAQQADADFVDGRHGWLARALSGYWS